MNADSTTLQRFVLPNGLRVWIEPRPQAESITALLAVRVGSRSETAANNGISHFVEHLVFDGTEKWPTEEAVSDAITHRGGRWNGWTSDEQTIYFVQLAHADTELAIEWLSQIVFHPIFPADKIDKERNIIFSEKLGRYGWLINTLEALGLGYDLDRQIRRAVFPGSALSLRTIGEDASLDRITREALLAHHHTHYTPANCVLIITGQGTVSDLHALALRYFGAVAARPTPAPPPTPPLPKRGPQRVAVRGPLPTAESVLMIGLRTVEWTHSDRWALEVLAQIMEERLLKTIRFQRGLAYDVHVFADYFSDTGYFGLGAQVESRHCAQVQCLIEEEFDHIRQGQLTADEVSSAQAALIGRHALDMEDNFNRAAWLARWAVTAGDHAPPDFAAAIGAVTPVEVQRVLNAYYTPQRRFVGVHTPLTTVPHTARLMGAALGLNVAILVARGIWRWVRRRRELEL